MTGSERMLKAHHKNAVFNKHLQVKKNAFDATCNKRLSKVQQEIYHIYFNEYIPLKQQSKEIKSRLPRISNGRFDDRWTKQATIPGTRRGSRVRLPEIHTLSLVSSALQKQQDKSESFLDLLRQKDQEIVGTESKPKHMKRLSATWSDSESDDAFEIDEERWKILKTAIALTSQPAPTPEKREIHRRHRRSLFRSRRHTRHSWDGELGDSHSDKRKVSTVTFEDEDEPIKEEEPVWQPSLATNRILNSDDESDATDFSFDFPERRTLIVTPASRSPSIQKDKHKRLSDTLEADFYSPESSPDIFGLMSDSSDESVTGSSYTDYSKTETDSDVSTSD